MSQLGLNLGYILIHALNFFIMLLVLRAWVYTPLIEMIEKRRAAVAKEEADAAFTAAARQHAEDEAAMIIDEAQKKAANLIVEATDRANKTTSEKLDQLDDELARTREQALLDVERERLRVLNEARDQIIALALAGSERIILEELDEKKHQALLKAFYTNLNGDYLDLPDGFSPQTCLLEVTTAIPLQEEERLEMINQLQQQMHCHNQTLDWRWKVKPDIIGGVILRAGDKIIDDSISGKLQQLKNAIKL